MFLLTIDKKDKVMFYRQKILLALIEINGRTLYSTDLEKLLFLFCQQTQHNHYDFFPHHFGAFSFLTYYDKQKLINQGHLKDSKQFELATNSSYLQQLKARDCWALQSFTIATQNLRGRNLIRKTYLEYPEYVIRSQIIDKTLEPEEIKSLQYLWNKNPTPMLFTIGYEGKTIDEYLRNLIFNNIKVLVDVRCNPFSRKHGFSQKELRRYLESAGIKYIHMPELGVASHLRKEITTLLAYESLFNQYEADVLPKNEKSLEKIINLVTEHQQVALTCFEADHCMCHRHKITQALETHPLFTYSIQHI